MWLALAFLGPALYAWSNILDNLLVSRRFKDPFSLVFYASLFNLIFLPAVFLFERPTVPALSAVPVFIGLGLINVLYLYPYYRALQVEDTSVAVSFFSLGRIFIPIWAYLIVGERLTYSQYAGVLLVVVSAILLSLSRTRLRFRLSKALWLMLLAAFILSFESVLLKYLFTQELSWSTVVSGEMFVSFALGMGTLAFPKLRRRIALHYQDFRKNALLFGAEEACTFLAYAFETAAIKLAPVSSVKSISLFTSFFALFYAWALGQRFPALFKEDVRAGSLAKKITLFLTMMAGVLLIASPGK